MTLADYIAAAKTVKNAPIYSEDWSNAHVLICALTGVNLVDIAFEADAELRRLQAENDRLRAQIRGLAEPAP